MTRVRPEVLLRRVTWLRAALLALAAERLAADPAGEQGGSDAGQDAG